MKNIMDLPQELLQNDALSKWAILLAYRGSIAHNMYIPSYSPDSIDDVDIMGVCVPPIDYYYGLSYFGSRDTLEIKIGEYDVVVYEALKFINLLAVGNPNVLSMLWLNPKHYLAMPDAGRMLIRNRKLFVGRHVYKSFSGYAHDQLHKMVHYASQGYMGEKRKHLVTKYGFDCKNAAHCIRLLRMGIEFMYDGELYVERPDAEQLLEIKRGEWTLEQVQAEAERLFKVAEIAHQRSTLPDGLDTEAINKLCVEIIYDTHKERGEYEPISV